MANDIKQAANDFLKGALDFEGMVYGESLKIREASKSVFGPLLDARLTLMAVAHELFTLKALVPGKTDERISERLLLTAVFFQGVYATETLVSEGQYIKAAAALKQDFEIVARIGEIAQGTDKYGKTPNAKYAPEGSQKFYGQLNDVAHIAKSDLLQDLVSVHADGMIRALSPVPRFYPDVAKGLYELHVWLLLQLCREMIALYFELYGNESPEVRRALQWFLTTTEILRTAAWTIEDAHS